MRKFLFGFCLLLVGCASTQEVVELADGKKMVNYTNRAVMASASDATNQAMRIAAKDCGDKKINLINQNSEGSGLGRFPTATIIYECK